MAPEKSWDFSGANKVTEGMLQKYYKNIKFLLQCQNLLILKEKCCKIKIENKIKF